MPKWVAMLRLRHTVSKENACEGRMSSRRHAGHARYPHSGYGSTPRPCRGIPAGTSFPRRRESSGVNDAGSPPSRGRRAFARTNEPPGDLRRLPVLDHELQPDRAVPRMYIRTIRNVHRRRQRIDVIEEDGRVALAASRQKQPRMLAANDLLIHDGKRVVEYR